MSKRGKILYCIVVTSLFFLTIATIFFVNRLVHFQMDDNWYMTFLYKDEKIKNFFDIFKAQKWHYMNWGGRSMTHTILQLVLLSGELVADILNTVMMILTGVIVTFMSETMTRLKRRFPERLLCTTIVMAVLVGLNANWNLSLCWQAGACNYLYITVFILLFMWVYMREIPYDCFGSKEPLWGVGFWIIPLGLIAGWSNENMGPVAFIFSVMTILYVKKVGHNVEVWMIIGSVCSLLGSVACILAPGNLVRAQEALEKDNHGLGWKVYERLYYESQGLFTHLFIVVLLLLFSIAICKSFCNINVGREIIYIIVCAILSWGAFVMSPHYPDRATYGTLVLIVLSITAIWVKIFEKKPQSKKYLYLGAGFIWLRAMFLLVTYICYNLGSFVSMMVPSCLIRMASMFSKERI